MARNRENGSILDHRPVTTLGAETHFKGTLKFDSSLRIDGKFEGEILSQGVLIIGEGADVKADLEAGVLVIGGAVTGNVTATDRLEMLRTGKLVGNIRTRKLKVADGVLFEGKCEMIRAEPVASAELDPSKRETDATPSPLPSEGTTPAKT
jgi:cytoskeletal protein CcmA (bactofilin family)